MRALLAFLVLGVPAQAGDFSSAARGTTTATFLKMGAGARASGLGEAYSAVADDATALYWNPAALRRSQGRTATFMHAAYLESSFLDYGAYVQDFRGGRLGLGIQYFSAGTLDETDAAGADRGSLTPNDLAVTAGYAADLHDFAVGGSVKYVQSRIVDTARTAALDLGLLSPDYLDGRLRLAAAASNLGGKMKFESEKEDLPLVVRFGSAYRLMDHWLAALDLALPKDNKPGLGFGTEYLHRLDAGTQLAGRLGYNTRAAGEVSGLTGVSFGLGFGFERFAVDYAMVPFGDLGLTHRMSLSMRFGKGAPAVAALPEEPEVKTVAPSTPIVQTLPPEVAASTETAQAYQQHADAASTLLTQGDREGARRELLEAEKLLAAEDERRVFISEHLGTLAFLDGELDKAKSHFAEAIGIARQRGIRNESLADAYVGMAGCLAAKGRRAAAIRNYRKARELTANPETRTRIDWKLSELKAPSGS